MSLLFVMNGWELSRLVKTRAPETPVVIVAGHEEESHWERMNMRYVDAIVMKPLKLKEIDKTVQDPLLTGRT
jgi:DNA-binding NarL/FixJ family response regulator